jgi:hypothetical protein
MADFVYGLAGLSDIVSPPSTLGGGGGSSFTPVRVVDIVLSGDHPRFGEVGEWNGIGTIFYNSVTDPTTQNNTDNQAKPAFPNIKQFPLINEIVYLFSLPLPNSQEEFDSQGNYYFTPINIWNSQHHNAVPNGLVLNAENASDYSSTRAGLVRRVQDEGTDIFLGNTFDEEPDIHPLLPFEGDLIYEGRWGNSIRFGSTVSGSSNDWSVTGSNGDPITIIRNGQNPNIPTDGWVPTVEDINRDLSSIYLTSTQKLPINVASSNYNSYSSYTPTIPNQYSGKQVILNSGRLVFNSTSDHILLSSALTIGFNAIKGFNFDTKANFVINAPSIRLGSKDAAESLMLGDKTVTLLNDVLTQLISVVNDLGQLAAKPIIGGAAPDPKLIATTARAKIKLTNSKNKLNTLLSKQNKTI